MSLSFIMFIAFSLSIHTTKKLHAGRQPDNKSTDSGPPTRLPVLDQRRSGRDAHRFRPAIRNPGIMRRCGQVVPPSDNPGTCVAPN